MTEAPSARPDDSVVQRPTLFQLARTWFAIGTQSLGGGPSSLYMIRSLMVERTRWIPPETFRECWSIGQASPGIHLVALAGLLGAQAAMQRHGITGTLRFFGEPAEKVQGSKLVHGLQIGRAHV
mgnify:CR=1 FL=1